MTENVPKPIRSASDCVWRRERRLRESWDVSRRLAERLGAGLGTLLDASWPLLGHPGRHLVGFGAPLGRPRGAPSVSGRVPKTALGAENGPGSIFRRLRIRFGGFFHVFSIVCWFAFRSSCFPQCTGGQRPNHTTIARDPPNDKRNAQVSRSSCVLLLQLACATSAIIPTTCDPTIVTLRQGKCT